MIDAKLASFHQVAKVCGIWIIALCVGIHTMAAMRGILVPLFWAFFIMMGLVPATEQAERLLLHCTCRHRRVHPHRSPSDGYAGLKGVVSPREEAGTRPDSRSESVAQEERSDQTTCVVRTVAVIFVATTSLAVVMLFFVLIYMSALHMQEGWSHYKDGLKAMTRTLKRLINEYAKMLPDGVLDDISDKALTSLEEGLSLFLRFVVGQVTGSMSSAAMMLLYMMFWLCQPMHIGKTISGVFKNYILLKSLCSLGYAACVWLLLYLLSVDLAVVFALVTFLFNFVPEVGPFLAMALPLPIVLFDGRNKNPLIQVTMVLSGNLFLKCVWGNIIEVKSIESSKDMKLHPVVILFCVAFFGWIWGATGMLLSVPAVAVCKASMHLIPPEYRDPMLVLLEGDTEAPENFNKWRSEETLKSQQTSNQSFHVRPSPSDGSDV